MATATSSPSTVDADFGTVGKKPGDRIQCVVVTPERTLFDELVEFVSLPLLDGELGILPGRSPLIGRLGYGELRTRSQGATKRYFIDGGFVQVRDNLVTVLTNRAIPADLVQADIARVELDQARARKASNEGEVTDRSRAVERAQAMIRVARHQGKV